MTLIWHIIGRSLTVIKKQCPTKKYTTAQSQTWPPSDDSNWDGRTAPPNLTCLPVVALHIDTEHRNPLPLHVVVIEIDVRDGDVPGWEVSGGAGGGGRLHGGVILQHHHGFLYLWMEGSERGEGRVKLAP